MAVNSNIEFVKRQREFLNLKKPGKRKEPILPAAIERQYNKNILELYKPFFDIIKNFTKEGLPRIYRLHKVVLGQYISCPFFLHDVQIAGNIYNLQHSPRF